MKIKPLVTGIVLCSLVVLVSGCKKEESAPEAQITPQANTPTAPDLTKVADTAKATASQVATQVAGQATAQAQAAERQAQGVIDRAKSFVAEKKYQDALTSLNQLANLKLTPEQQKLVDDLKAQIQSALAKATASDAASALGGALGGKK